MNRTKFVRHLKAPNCIFVREGGKHTIFKNPANGALSAVPRHREIKKILALKVCDDLGIPRPPS